MKIKQKNNREQWEVSKREVLLQAVAELYKRKCQKKKNL